jgi:hypothetical protein
MNPADAPQAPFAGVAGKNHAFCRRLHEVMSAETFFSQLKNSAKLKRRAGL